ncbi:hypothetical protein MUG91_G446n2 [Manis pentadactyla]|nr:hypothetical protein MUG91_G446n2 [Manis pentadactyla]
MVRFAILDYLHHRSHPHVPKRMSAKGNLRQNAKESKASPTTVEAVFEETKFKLCECLILPFFQREKIFLTNTPRVWDKFS